MRQDRRLFTLAPVVALAFAAGCTSVPVVPTASPVAGPATGSPPVAASATPVTLTDPPVTLRLAVSDGPGRSTEPAVNTFVASVAATSGGNITIEPTFGAGDDTAQGFELGVAELVKHGDFDLAVVASRAWDLAGVTSLQAFQAPYLIDNEALFVAVGQSEIAQRALDEMGNGVVGLIMWPEDLRHLFAFPSCSTDFTSPEGVSGRTVLYIPSGLSHDLIVGGLGAAEYVEDDRHLDAESCKLQGQENGLGQLQAMALDSAVATGNVTLFPKYQVLVANSATFEHLSATQRQILIDAAADAQADAIAKRQSDAPLSLAWCAKGGSVVLATAAQQQAFVATGAAVYEHLRADPFTNQLITDIEALKSSTPADPATAAQPCTGTSSFVPAPTSATSDGVGFSGDVPPIGTYRGELTVEGLMAQGATLEWATRNAGVWTWTWGDGRYSYTEQAGNECHGTIETVEKKYFHLELDPGQSVNCIGGDFLWKEVPEGILLSTFIDQEHTSAEGYWEIYRWINRVWVKIQ